MSLEESLRQACEYLALGYAVQNGGMCTEIATETCLLTRLRALPVNMQISSIIFSRTRAKNPTVLYD